MSHTANTKNNYINIINKNLLCASSFYFNVRLRFNHISKIKLTSCVGDVVKSFDINDKHNYSREFRGKATSQYTSHLNSSYLWRAESICQLDHHTKSSHGRYIHIVFFQQFSKFWTLSHSKCHLVGLLHSIA